MRRICLVSVMAFALIISTNIATTTPAAAASKTVSAKSLLKKLPVKSESRVKYSRAKFPHWTTKNGCNTRARVLSAESRKKVSKNKYCTVKKGRWVSQYDGKTVTTASKLDIDHRVALAEAWRSGAHRWSTSRRRAFANDEGYSHSLLAVTAASNRSKSDHDPAAWWPKRARCQYAARWVAVKYRWKLAVDKTEKQAISRQMGKCTAKQLRLKRPNRR